MAPVLNVPAAAAMSAGAAVAGPATSVLLRPPPSGKPDPRGGEDTAAGTGTVTTGVGCDTEREPPDRLPEILWAILQPPISALFDPDGVLKWPAEIRPFQRDGIAVLLDRAEVLLADEMGLGKTIQTIAALRILAFRGLLGPVLVVCPASLLTQWQQELSLWAPELEVRPIQGRPEERATKWRTPAHIRLVSYETLRSDVLDVRDSIALRCEWDVVVLDEASRIKNRDTGISLACRRLPRSRRWVLTGTPLENRADDLATILEFLLGDPERPRSVSPDVLNLRMHLGRVQLRRKKADVLPELPPKEVREVWLELHPRQRAAYDEAEKAGIYRLQTSTEPITVTHVLELISRLKQICNRDLLSSESAKLDDLAERLEELAEVNQRALVFSQYVDERYGVRWIAEALSRLHPLVYTGDMSVSERQRALDAFVSDTRHRVLVLSLRAGGMGLNLQSASYVFHVDRWWNPAIESQAEDRAHRMGQQTPVTVYRYICADTIEERIDAKLREKRELFNQVVEDVSLDLSRSLSEEELFGLFGLSPPRATRTTT